MEVEKKQFKFKGKTIEELKKLDVREFSKFLKSKQRRTILRRFNEIEKFISKSKAKIAKNKPIKTHRREFVVTPEMIGMKIQIYNGNKFVSVIITEEMLGHKFGEFALTRGRVSHGKAGVGATKGTKALAKK